MSAEPAEREGLAPRLEAAALRRIRLVGALALLLAALGLNLGWHEGQGPFANRAFDQYQRWMPRTVERIAARVVGIDDRSLAAIGPWPWPRSWLATLQQAAFDRGALAIGYDVLFAETDRYGPARLADVFNLPSGLGESLQRLPDPDGIFAESIARLPVVLGRVGVDRDAAAGATDPAGLSLEAAVTVEGPAASRTLAFASALTAIDPLDSAAAGHGLLNGAPGVDGVVRSLPLVARVGQRLMPGFAVELLRVAVDADGIAVATRRDGSVASVRFGDTVVPTDARGQLRLHFAPSVAQRFISAVDLLNGEVPADAFAGQVVIIGPAAVGLGDIVATPLSGETFGVDLHAQAVDSLVAGAWLVRPAWSGYAEWALLAMFGLGAVLALPWVRPVVALGATLAGLAGLAIWGGAAFAWGRLLFDPGTPMLGFAATALSILAMVMVETERRRGALRRELQEAQVRQARFDGELAAAREIQLGILPDPARIDGLPAALDVAALLEPAREIGGDLYDLYVLDERRLFFMIGDVTGKGVPAALFMAIVKVLARGAVARGADNLAAAVARANFEIGRENPGQLLVTAVAGVIDAETGEIGFCNAGHDAPLRLAAGADPVPLESEGGPPFCVWDDFDYPVEKVLLAPGETLLITTDGVTEARDPEGGLYGPERLAALFAADTVPPADAAEAVERVRVSIRAFEAGRESGDDLTVLAIRLKPGPDGGGTAACASAMCDAVSGRHGKAT